jgi:hypothetical protein
MFVDEHLVPDRRMAKKIGSRHGQQVSFQIGVAFGPIGANVTLVSELTHSVKPLLEARSEFGKHVGGRRSSGKTSAVHGHRQRIPGREFLKPEWRRFEGLDDIVPLVCARPVRRLYVAVHSMKTTEMAPAVTARSW